MNENEEIRIACTEAMGWIFYPETDTWRAFWSSPDGRMHLKDHLPNFPVDANAALTLAHALADKGWIFNVRRAPECHFLVEFTWFKEFPHKRESAWAETFALALCRAYLAAVRTGKEQQG